MPLTTHLEGEPRRLEYSGTRRDIGGYLRNACEGGRLPVRLTPASGLTTTT